MKVLDFCLVDLVLFHTSGFSKLIKTQSEISFFIMLALRQVQINLGCSLRRALENCYAFHMRICGCMNRLMKIMQMKIMLWTINYTNGVTP